MSTTNIYRIAALIFFGFGLSMSEDFPRVKGEYRMTREWSIGLPTEFKRRFEDDNLVIWKPGLTFWIAIWGNNKGESIEERVKRFQEESSREKKSERLEEDKGQAFYTYELKARDESREIKEYFAIHAFKVNDSGHVQIGAYADSDDDKKTAYKIIRSIKYHPKN